MKIINYLVIVLLSITQSCVAQKSKQVKRIDVSGQYYSIQYSNDSIEIWDENIKGKINMDSYVFVNNKPFIVSYEPARLGVFKFEQFNPNLILELDKNKLELLLLRDLYKVGNIKFIIERNTCYKEEYLKDKFIVIKRMLSVYDELVNVGVDSKDIDINLNILSINDCFQFFEATNQIIIRIEEKNNE